MTADRPMWIVVALLGATQIVGYGTLFYTFPLLAADIATEIGWSEELVFGGFSLGLIVSALVAPQAGRLADRYGAARTMTAGSFFAALALAILALAPGRAGFVAGVVATQAVGPFVLYSAAFVVLVQVGGTAARRRITHLTLIAGFASTLFWPLTAFLQPNLSWREIYLVYAALNLAICLPAHVWLSRLSRTPAESLPRSVSDSPGSESIDGHPAERLIFLVMLAGFAVEGLVLSAVLVHMVPLLGAVGLGTSALLVAAMFGPAQVASRFVNLLLGRALSQVALAVIASTMLPASILVLGATAPSLPGAILFAILFGMASGLQTIVQGTLPLALFGPHAYGVRLGWSTSARLFAGAFAPFAFAALSTAYSIVAALWIMGLIGLAGIATFVAIALLARRS